MCMPESYAQSKGAENEQKQINCMEEEEERTDLRQTKKNKTEIRNSDFGQQQ